MGLNRHDFGNRNMMRSDFRRGKEADFRRMMELEGLKQSGATKRTNLTNEADYRRQGLMNTGSLERTKLSNTGSLAVAKTRAGESGRQFDMSHSLNRKRNLFDMANEDRKFALNREKETFDQFDAINDMGMDALGGKSTSSFGDRMNSWNTFRENSGGLTKKTIDFAIAKKLSDAKVKGIPVKNINFTDAERESFFSDTKGVGKGTGQRKGNALDWIEGEDGRRRHFNQSGREVEAPGLSNIGRPKMPYQHNYGAALPGSRGQSPLDASRRQPKAFGESFIRSNLGHAIGVDKAHNIATGFNRMGSKAWDLSKRASNAMVNRGIKPALKWANQEYDPY